MHGGVRYLRQGNISLVLEALKERGRLLQNAPHVVRNQSFVIPNYKWWEKTFYGIGLKIYDKMAGKRSFGDSGILSKKETLDEIPTLDPEHLVGGVQYFDGQFDDSRLAINLMQSIYDHHGIALNYVKATGLIKKNGYTRGVEAVDVESGEKLRLHAKVVINATGIFTDSVRRMDNPEISPVIQVSQGVHIVLDQRFQPGNSALMIPRTTDGRVLFAVPWYDKVIVGTTDTPVEAAVLEPRALVSELDFLLGHCARYMTTDPKPEDIKSVFTGLRPLVKEAGRSNTKKLSRDHTIFVDPTGLITVTGGKWTTYRKMAEDTVNQAVISGNLEKRKSVTEELRLHGWTVRSHTPSYYHRYGSDAEALEKIENENTGWSTSLHEDINIRPPEVIWAVRYEMARTIEDVLSRRTRSLLLDAGASMDVAETVGNLIALELGRDESWKKVQVAQFKDLAMGYHYSEHLAAGGS